MAALTTQERYDEAVCALHALLTGTSARQVRDSNGEEVTYTSANIAQLRRYIAELAAELGLSTNPNRPAGAVF